MNSPDDCTGPINLGNPHEMTVRELAERIITMTSSQSELIYRPLPQDEPTQRCPNTGLAKKTLDWQPAVPIEQGLARTIDYFRGVPTG